MKVIMFMFRSILSFMFYQIFVTNWGRLIRASQDWRPRCNQEATTATQVRREESLT